MTRLALTTSLKRLDTGTSTGRLTWQAAGHYRQAATIPVGTSEVTIAIDPAIGTPGLLYVMNHTDPSVDPTNYVDIGWSTGNYPHRLYAGEHGLIPVDIYATTIYVLASDADTKFQYELTQRGPASLVETSESSSNSTSTSASASGSGSTSASASASSSDSTSASVSASGSTSESSSASSSESGPPSGLTATAYAYNQISLDWDAVAGTDWYDIEVQDGGGRWNHLRSVYATDVDMAGFDASTTYYFRVRSVQAGFPDWIYGAYATANATTDAYQVTADYTVANDSDWTTAYNNAVCGDVIEINTGVVLTEKNAIPYRTGTAKFLTIRSSAMGSLPGFDDRVNPSDTANMPMFRTRQPVQGAIDIVAGSHHVTFEGIRFATNAPTSDRTNFVVAFNKSFEDINNDPYNIEFHRCYLDSPPPNPPTYNQTDSGFFSYGAVRVVIKDTYIKEMTGTLSDTQGIAVLRGSEWAINNCYIEGGSENFMTGGSSHDDTGYNPNLFVIRRCHFNKPLTWKSDDPSYDGIDRVLKNLFEIKYAEHVLLQDNLLENGFGSDAGQAYTIVLTPRAEGDMVWVTDEDIHIEYNHIKKCDGGIMLLSADNLSQPTTIGTNRITIQHNLFEDVGWAGGTHTPFELDNRRYSSGLRRFENISITRNTAVSDFQIWNYLILDPSGAVAAGWPDGQGVAGVLNISDNIVDFGVQNPPGVNQSGVYGVQAMDASFGAGKYTWQNNVQFGNTLGLNNATWYPNQIRLTAGIADVGFVDHATHNYRLSVASPYYGLRGADNSVYDRTAYCTSGDWTS